MPTFERTERFRRDFRSLTPEQQRRVLAMVRQFVRGLERGRYDRGLRVKRVKGHAAVWEVT